MEEVPASRRSVGLRCSRALGVSLLAWGVTSPAHVLAGGSVPGVMEAAFLVLLTAWPLVAVLGGTPARSRLALALLGAQAAMHCLMEFMSSPMAGPSNSPALHAMGHHGHVSVAAAPAGATDPLVQVTSGPGVVEGMVPGPVMIGVHLIAALVVGLVLANGEKTFRSALAVLAAVLLPIGSVASGILCALRAAAGSVPELARVRPERVAAVQPASRVLDLVASRVVRRGPPAII